jgi:hypothetical protein
MIRQDVLMDSASTSPRLPGVDDDASLHRARVNGAEASLTVGFVLRAQ